MTTEHPKESGRQAVRELVEKFGANLSYYKSSSYNESQVRAEFIDPFLVALGWDVRDDQRLGVQREVLVESTEMLRSEPAGELDWDDDLTQEEILDRSPEFTRPDYVVRLDGAPCFVIEAKKPSVNLRYKKPAFQAKSYGYSMQLPIALLTDFEELRVFSARMRPSYDQPHAGIAEGLDLKYTDYYDRWNDIWGLLSRQAVSAGSMDQVARREAESHNPVDVEFLRELSAWRLKIAQSLYYENAGLDRWSLAEATQRILDRVVFMRVLEDRGIIREPKLRKCARIKDAYRAATNLFSAMDSEYNGQIFKPHFSEQLVVPDPLFQQLVASLYAPISPYRFEVLGADILGKVYEQFLGEEISIENDVVALEQKLEVRQAGGVFYTPAWIVDRIVGATLGEKLEKLSDKTPASVANLKVVDPSCGSGAFLLKAFDALVDWHVGYYERNPNVDTEKHFIDMAEGERRLTSDAKSEILANNIYGVDIDVQAVEVTQMSLYLAMLKDENRASLGAQTRLFQSAYLPALDKNIRWGNALLTPGQIPQELLFEDNDLYHRTIPFDWADRRHGFGSVIQQRNGFDVVIGNPPYTKIQTLQKARPEETKAYQAHFKSASKGSFDISMPFMERALRLLRSDGVLGFIVSRQFCEVDAGVPIRGMLSKGKHVRSITDFGDGLVFGDKVGAYTCIVILTLKQNRTFDLTKVPRPSAASLVAAGAAGSSLTAKLDSRELSDAPWLLQLPAEADLAEKLSNASTPLGELASSIFQGVPTGADYVFLVNDMGPDPHAPGRRLISHRKDSSDRGSIEAELLKPVLHGRSDIKRFSTVSSGEALLYLYEPIPAAERTGSQQHRPMSAKRLATFPGAESWVKSHEAALRDRKLKIVDGRFWAYSRPQNLGGFAQEKVMVPYMLEDLCAHLDDEGMFFVNVATGGYCITLKPGDVGLQFLAAVLESSVASWSVRQHSRAFRGGWMAVRKATLRQIPIPRATPEEMAEILAAHGLCQQNKTRVNGAESDSERSMAERAFDSAVHSFDALVDGLYGLSEADRQLVDVTVA